MSHTLIERHLCLVEISSFIFNLPNYDPQNVDIVSQWMEKMSNLHVCEAPVFCFLFCFFVFAIAFFVDSDLLMRQLFAEFCARFKEPTTSKVFYYAPKTLILHARL